MANVWVYPKGRDEWEEERRPEKMMDVLRKRARRAQLGRTWRWGVLCAAGPSPVPRLPIPSPHSTPMRALQPPFPSKYFQGNLPKMEASSSHGPMLN